MPCRSAPMTQGSLCFLHDPAEAEHAAKARSLGGLRRRREGTIFGAFDFEDIRTLDGLWRAIQVILADTLSLDNGVARNRTLIAIVTVAARLITTDSIERRLAAIERGLAPASIRPAPADAPGLLQPDQP